MDGKEFFSQNSDNKDKCKALQAIPVETLSTWEAEGVSEISPGPISNEEEVARQIFCPLHWDEEVGKLKPNFFDDASNKGLSSDRLSHATVAEIVERGLKRQGEKDTADKPYKYRGLASLSVSAVRNITEGDKRLLGVFDTAQTDNASHCDICVIAAGKQASRSARAKLYEIHKLLEN